LASGAGPQLREIRVADGAAAVDAKISSAISSASGIMKTGPGTLELSATNTYDGATEIDEGTLLLSGTMDAIASGAGTGFFINNGSTLRVSGAPVASHYFNVSAGTIDLVNSISYNSQGITMGGGLAGTTSTITTGTGTMGVGADGLTYNGHFNNDNGATISGNLSLGTTVKPFVINDSTAAANDVLIAAVISGTGGISKTGNGTANLAAANTYSGTTTINAGKLLISGSLTGTAGAVTVNSGGALGGIGSLSRTVTINNGGMLAPGTTTGTLDIGNALTLGAGSILKVELGGNTAGDGAGFYDQVNMTDATKSIALNNTAALTLGFDNGFVPSPSDIFYILTRADAGVFSTSFAGAAEGAALDFGSMTAQITYLANWTGTDAGSTLTGGNDIALFNFIAVPEPGSAAVLLLGMGAVFYRGRSRRRL
jgi:autotransporter-associated beta strand protein